MTDTDLIAIVPTKGRPHLIPRLVNGIHATAGEPVDVMLVICESEWPVYAAVVKELQAAHPDRLLSPMLVKDDATYPSKLNDAGQYLQSSGGDYHFYALFNDDHEPVTPGWDVALKDAIGDEYFAVAYGPDGVWEEGQVPTAPVVTASLFETLGYLALPTLGHILVDNVWMDLARWCGTLHFLPEVRIQHHHIDNGEAEPDATYLETQNNDERNARDREVYASWFTEDRWVEGDKLRALWPDESLVPARQFASWE